MAVDATFCFSHTAPLCHFAKCIVTMSLFPAKWSYSFYYPNRRATRVDTFTPLHGPWSEPASASLRANLEMDSVALRDRSRDAIASLTGGRRDGSVTLPLFR